MNEIEKRKIEAYRFLCYSTAIICIITTPLKTLADGAAAILKDLEESLHRKKHRGKGAAWRRCLSSLHVLVGGRSVKK